MTPHSPRVAANPRSCTYLSSALGSEGSRVLEAESVAANDWPIQRTMTPRSALAALVVRVSLVAMVVLCALLTISLPGCGYRLKGRSMNLPPGIHAIAVPLFENRRYETRLEQFLTDAVIQELSRFRELRIEESSQADALLKGVITDYSIRPQQVSAAGVVEEYLFVLLVDVRLENLATGDVIYEEKGFRFSQAYPASGDIDTRLEVQEDAWQQACDDMAELLVSTMVEGF